MIHCHGLICHGLLDLHSLGHCGTAHRSSTPEYITAKMEMQAPAAKIPWKLLLSKAPVWALIVCHFCHNWGTFILLTWMPTYYNQVLGLDLLSSGIYSVLPWVTMAVSANVGGWIADTLVGRGYSVTLVRKLMQTVRPADLASSPAGAETALAFAHSSGGDLKRGVARPM